MESNLSSELQSKIYNIRTSVNSEKSAREIALFCVEGHFAASAHVREINSIYRWKNKVEDITEYEVAILTTTPTDVVTAIKSLHPYDLCEIIVCECNTTNEFGEWVKEGSFCE